MYCYSVPSKFIHIYFLLKRKGLNGVKKKRKVYIKHKRTIDGYFLCARPRSEAPRVECHPHSRELYLTNAKQKIVENHQSGHWKMKLYNRRT